MGLFNKNKNKISRRRRLEVYKSGKRGLGLSLSRPVIVERNLPKHYANDVFGRPSKGFFISITRIFIFAIIVTIIIYICLFSSFFRIRNIVVTNNQVLLESDIVKFLEETNIKNKNIFLLDGDQVRNILLDYYKRIEDVRVYKAFPSKLRIKIKEKPSTLVWQSGARRYILDNKGYVMSEVNEDVKMPVVIDSAALPVKIGDKIVTENFIEFANTADESLKKRFGLGVNNYNIEQTTYELKANVNSGFYIMFDTTADIVEQLNKLANVYQQGEVVKEYVILSIEGKVIVK